MSLDVPRSFDPHINEEWLEWQTNSRAEYELFQTIKSLLDKDVEDCVKLIEESDEPEDMARFLLEIAHTCKEKRKSYSAMRQDLKKVRTQIRQAVAVAVQSKAFDDEDDEDEDDAS